MHLEWVILAEGLGQDSRGTLTLIGINQNVLSAPTLPVTTKRAIVGHITFEEGEEVVGQFQVTIRFESPSGSVLNAATSVVNVPPNAQFPFPELPRTLDVPAELVVTVTEHGTHEIRLEVMMMNGQVLRGSVPVYVTATAPSSIGPIGAAPVAGVAQQSSQPA